MRNTGSNAQSFIVKIWLEESRQETGHAAWRGHITHVPSGERRYLQDMDDISLFIIPHLELMGVTIGLGWQCRRYWNRLKTQLWRR